MAVSGRFQPAREAVKMISTSEIKISCLIAKDRSEEAVQVIHDEFKLGSLSD